MAAVPTTSAQTISLFLHPNRAFISYSVRSLFAFNRFSLRCGFLPRQLTACHKSCFLIALRGPLSKSERVAPDWRFMHGHGEIDIWIYRAYE